MRPVYPGSVFFDGISLILVTEVLDDKVIGYDFQSGLLYNTSKLTIQRMLDNNEIFPVKLNIEIPELNPEYVSPLHIHKQASIVEKNTHRLFANDEYLYYFDSFVLININLQMKLVDEKWKKGTVKSFTHLVHIDQIHIEDCSFCDGSHELNMYNSKTRKIN
jgi:hypothetical protein